MPASTPARKRQKSAGARSRPAGRPRDRQATKAILDVALSHLARYGYSGLSLEGVAAEAGVTKPTLYRRWSSKEDLVTSALFEWRNRDMPQASGDAIADLQANLRQMGRLLQEPQAFAILGALLVQESSTPELMELYRERAIEPRKEAIRSILDDAKRKGLLGREADAESFMAMLLGAYYWKLVSGEPIPAAWPEQLIGSLMRRSKS